MVHRITSVHNPRVKSAVRLRDRSGREAQQRIIIDGPREIARALGAGVQVVELFTCEPFLSDAEHTAVAQAVELGATVYDLLPAVMGKLSYGDRAAGLVAVAVSPQRSLDPLAVPHDATVAVLERVEKPGNVGAVVRSADAAGVTAVILADGGTDLFNPNAIRASAGTIFSLPVVSAPIVEVLAWLRQGGFHILATRTGGSVNFWDVKYDGRTAIVLGNEALGLSDHWVGPGIESISIPLLGMADSLNVSVTAAILFYEVLRQRASLGARRIATADNTGVE